MVITCVLFLNFFIKATCTVPHSNSHGDIMGHIFAIKTISIALYPTYGEYINFCFGFMTADLPWINTWMGNMLSDASDYSPHGYLLYYVSMGIFSTYALPLLVVSLILLMVYLMLKDKAVNQFKLDRKEDRTSRPTNYRLQAMT